MSVEEYKKARKLALKQFKKAISQGKSPHPVVLDEILETEKTVGEHNLGTMEIPVALIAGTKTSGRTNAFSQGFLPLLGEASEFADKWRALYKFQIEEGIRDSIVVYEYKNMYYVQEGNKRVSVMKYLEMPVIMANVTRILPVRDDSDESKLYYEYTEFFERTGVCNILFAEPGSYGQLLKAVGKDWDSPWTTDEVKQLTSVFHYFSSIYCSVAKDDDPRQVGVAFLRCLDIFPYEELAEKSFGEIKREMKALKNEIAPESLSAEIERVMHPEDDKPSVMSLLFHDKVIKAAFVYEGDAKGSEWNYSHELGRLEVEETFGGHLITSVYDMSRPELTRAEVIEEAVKDGNTVIFTTGATLMKACVQVALKYPDIRFFNCSLNYPYKSVRTYITRTYEMKFLLGIIAGILSEDDVIGYVEEYPIYGSVANINAFALGAQMVRPEAKVKVFWECLKEPESKKEMEKISIISGRRMFGVEGAKEPYGLYRREENGYKVLATGVIKWGKFYERLIRYILDGTWKSKIANDKKTLNYWWGLSAGVTELICSKYVPKETQILIESFEKSIANGEFHPFEEVANTEEIVTMNTFRGNVIGSIPDISELVETARELVELQGM